MVKITLIGDSILDNFYWLSDKTKDLKYELKTLGYKVDNYAVDETQLHHVINGIKPNIIYQQSRHYPYPIDSGGYVKPMDLLNNSHTNMIVLSVLGNDLRVNQYKAIFGVNFLLNNVFNNKFLSDFDELVNTLCRKSNKVLLVIPYKPYIGEGSYYRMFIPFLDAIWNRLTEIFNNVATLYNIPILDLSKTFNCEVRWHYGNTEIEPSNITNKCLSKCIDYIYKNYHGYHYYYAKNCDIKNIN